MKRFLSIFLLLALLPMAVAETPGQTAWDVFDRVAAEETKCDAFFLELGEGYPYLYCGYISDQMTNINTRWAAEEYYDDGYLPAVLWHQDFAEGLEFWLSSYATASYTSTALLVLAEEIDGTFIMLVFE